MMARILTLPNCHLESCISLGNLDRCQLKIIFNLYFTAWNKDSHVELFHLGEVGYACAYISYPGLFLFQIATGIHIWKALTFCEIHNSNWASMSHKGNLIGVTRISTTTLSKQGLSGSGPHWSMCPLTHTALSWHISVPTPLQNKPSIYLPTGWA